MKNSYTEYWALVRTFKEEDEVNEWKNALCSKKLLTQIQIHIGSWYFKQILAHSGDNLNL